MAQPTVQDVHVDAILTNFAIRYLADTNMYIATKVFPVIPVDKKSDLYYEYNRADWFRDEAQRRAPATESAGGGYSLSTGSYRCDVWAFHKDIDHQTRANADSVIDLDRDASEFVTARLLLKQEKEWISTFFTATAGWTTTLDGDAGQLSGGVHWDDPTLSDPIGDIDNAVTSIMQTTGYRPNTLILGYNVYRKLRNHPDLIDRMKYVKEITGRTINEQALAAAFDIDRVLVASSVENTSQEGQTAAYSFTHGDHALLVYSAPAPNLTAPSGGYTFMWRGVSSGLGENLGITRFYMDMIKSWRVEGEVAFDAKLVAADMGYFFANAVS